MKFMHLFQVGALSASFAIGTVAAGQAQQLIVNGGFESGFSGWTALNLTGGDGSFSVQSGTASPVNGFSVPSPPEGAQAAMTDAQAGGSHLLYQNFTVPVGASHGFAQFSLFINSGDVLFSPASLDWAETNRAGALNLNQQARVDIISASADPFSVVPGDVLLNLFQTLPTDPLSVPYGLHTVDVSSLFQAHSGETLRLRFAEVDNVSFFNLGVDAVSIQAVPEPAPALFLTAGTLSFGALWLRRRRLVLLSQSSPATP